jgi:hypothetical protein
VSSNTTTLTSYATPPPRTTAATSGSADTSEFEPSSVNGNSSPHRTATDTHRPHPLGGDAPTSTRTGTHMAAPVRRYATQHAQIHAHASTPVRGLPRVGRPTGPMAFSDRARAHRRTALGLRPVNGLGHDEGPTNPRKVANNARVVEPAARQEQLGIDTGAHDPSSEFAHDPARGAPPVRGRMASANRSPSRMTNRVAQRWKCVVPCLSRSRTIPSPFLGVVRDTG